MKLRQLFDSALTNIAGNAFDLLKGAEKQTAKSAEKEVGAPASAKVVSQAKTQSKEKNGGSVGIIFGRFNPPHKGHRAAWMKAAKEQAAWYVGTNKDTQGPKDPLPFNVKIEAMQTIWPGIEGHLVAEQSWLTLASYAFKHNPNAAELVCYTDEAWVTKTVAAYNGKEGPHGFYNFKSVRQEQTERLSSATELRSAVQTNDREKFAKAAGVPADTLVAGKPFFDLVAHYLNQYPVKESAADVRDVNQIVRGMRSKVAEATNALGNKMKGKTAPLDKEYKASMKNMITMPDQNQSSGSAYLGWRMGIALAGAPDYPTKMAGDSWLGGDPLLSTYTPEELEMVKAATLQVGGGKIENWSGKRSEELPSVNKTSPIAKPKRNKYGI